MGQSLCSRRRESWTEPAVKPGPLLSLVAAAEGEQEHSGDVLAAGVLTDVRGEGPRCAEMH